MKTHGGFMTWRLGICFLVAGAGATLLQQTEPNYTLFSEVSIWIYSLLVAFLIDKALIRRHDLKQNINIELARLRHIHHVGEQLGRAFSKQVDRHLEAYQRALGEKFQHYGLASEAFRALSHDIYAFTPKTQKAQLLYADLLQTLQELTLSRQYVQYALTNQLGAYYWFLILLVYAGLLVLLFLPTDHVSPVGKFLLSWMTIFISVIPLEMLWKSDRYSAADLSRYQHSYLKNTPSALREKR